MNYRGYFKLYGNKSFEEFPFNDFDATMLAIMSYIKWETLLSDFDNDFINFKTLINKDIDKLSKETLDPPHHAKITKLIVNSPRYQEIKAKFLVNIVDFEKKFTFCAITFEIPGANDLVCYRGTDITVLAWEENFSQSLNIVTPSQKESLEYLEKVAPRISDKFYVCGHSKGGNLAIYSSTKVATDIQDRIIKVISLDGTGFYDDSFFKQDSYLRLEDRVMQIIPQSSYVGIIFYCPKNYKVVSSRYLSVLQHLPYSWRLKKDGSFKFIKHRTYTAVVRQRSLRLLVDKADRETKALAVDAIVTAMGGEDKDISFYLKHPRSIGKTIKNWNKKYSKEERKRIRKFAGLFFKSYVGSFFYLLSKKNRAEFKKEYYK